MMANVEIDTSCVTNDPVEVQKILDGVKAIIMESYRRRGLI